LQVQTWAEGYIQFRAMNRVIERNGLKVVTLMRLSPLLPLAASNYLYGVTNVSLTAYTLGSWIGMLPGTVLYVAAGSVSKSAFLDGDSLPLTWWQLVVVLIVSVAAVLYIGSLAAVALKELEEEEEQRETVVETATTPSSHSTTIVECEDRGQLQSMGYCIASPARISSAPGYSKAVVSCFT
jgi:hypothetical protein